eukprot:Skav217935  [mRNA]  locus=scaffold2849:132079:132465:+ [translate_table: standard]
MTTQTFERVYKLLEEARNQQPTTMKALLHSMHLNDLKTYEHYLKHGKATNKQKINAITEFNSDFAAVSDVIDALGELKKKMEEIASNAVTASCMTTEGVLRMAEFHKAVEVAIGIKEGIASAQMEAEL